jgi:hypothetical protein
LVRDCADSAVLPPSPVQDASNAAMTNFTLMIPATLKKTGGSVKRNSLGARRVL